MERDYVDWLRRTLPASPAAPLGIGDDAALISPNDDAAIVVTTDLLADGTHFLAAETDPRLVGRKCLAANLSDLAAMAAEPLAAFVSLLLPRDGAGGLDTATLAQRLTEGMTPLAEEFGVAIAGGDTNVWHSKLAVSVTALGGVTPRGALRRSGAQVGDRLLVTGDLGGSIEGHHLTFTPRIREALLLHERYTLHAGMDITDGLAIDLHRLAEASGVGAVVRAGDVPTSAAAERLAAASGGNPIDHALGDGEDFELLLAIPPADATALVRDQPLECGVTEIGEIVAEGMWLESTTGERQSLAAFGYLHGQ